MSPGAVRAVATIAAGRHGVFTRTEAASSGLSAHNIATAIGRGWVTEPIPGVLLVAGSPDTWRQRLSAVVVAGRGRAVASHRAAAVLHRLDGFDDPDASRADGARARPSILRRAAIDATIPQPHWYPVPRRWNAHLHQAAALDAADITSIDGVPCTGLARTLCDLGAVCSADHVWRALIAARRMYDLNPRWLAQTAARLERPGPTGIPTILRLLRRWADEGVLPDSWLEELLADPAIPPVARQFEVRDPAGRLVARVDAAVPSARLAFEGHSRRFHFGPAHEAADEDRDLRLAEQGYEVIYLGWYAAQSPAAVLARIRSIVRERLRLLAAAS